MNPEEIIKLRTRQIYLLGKMSLLNPIELYSIHKELEEIYKQLGEDDNFVTRSRTLASTIYVSFSISLFLLLVLLSCLIFLK